MAITSVVNTDEITVLGPPSSIDLQVDLGATGERGSIIYAAAGEPAGSGSVAFINVPPKVGDVFLQTDQENQLTIYQFISVPGNPNQWQEVTILSGAQGEIGPQGSEGPANTISIGTVSSGSAAFAEILGVAPNQTLNLILPQGIQGPQGAQGPAGSQGPAGVQGPVGDIGPEGPQGNQGEPGQDSLASFYNIFDVTSASATSASVIYFNTTNQTLVIDTSNPPVYIIGGEENTQLNLLRGQLYKFNINTPGNPAYIRSDYSNAASAIYDVGVSNNGTDEGEIDFRVPFESPDILYLISENEDSMQTILNIGTIVDTFNYPDLELTTQQISTSASTVLTPSIRTDIFRSLELDVQVSQNNTHRYIQAFAIHDGTNVTLEEFHDISVGSGSISFNLFGEIDTDEDLLTFYIEVDNAEIEEARVVASIKDRVPI